ncbi:hypothetical protein NEPAR06_0055 [Nematocida parisii]|uniref:Uncharacterized protein n=1 Tax=Nematocida parisii (strain ERTm3) TaxID=935791 RepID=I3EE22_NEMP3|nr:uncharacterized protein NEPG_00071 [Nematocida parisii ERTm1]EIJ87469.1 hypothetical protein NEQG_02350 [Nematocida parisii ERTm3]KAI5127079.1 hypothetical protein NEPAR08_0751 [Nematocida parisii]EIJ94549.1 hypothetical protein NEPG_00071 [Nematocida parisii ERTm1]KAI5127626.1 hypothetical protein NEPAR03_1016 [Nematocida parisii]KAI5141179.1 hypothetical protein NEPAR04_0750 [Nematocida parisii]|eukprot:XP_013057905.1 hypothetical protein NEPG_00071 [Nematocida parisii ERTm1]
MSIATGCISLIRDGYVDKQVDLLDRDPISMRTYLSLIFESLNKKRDIILAIVIPAEAATVPEADDHISIGIVCKGVVYLSECINLHRFTVTTTNPSVIAVSRKNVADPNMKCHIKNIYYYRLEHSVLSEIMNKKDKKLFKSLTRVLEDSPDAVAELARMNPVILSCNWIGTEHDYLNNSIFHTYIEQNKILGDIFDPKKASTRVIKKERKIFRKILIGIMTLMAIMFIARNVLYEFSYWALLSHLAVLSACGVVIFINERI